jgi:hypothetical protein
MTVAQTILNQLGGNKFVACTGSKNFVSDGNTLKMRLVGNRSNANHLSITLNSLDLYDMEFMKITEAKFNLKTGKLRKFEEKEIACFNGVFFDQLQEIFTSVTGLVTHL